MIWSEVTKSTLGFAIGILLYWIVLKYLKAVQVGGTRSADNDLVWCNHRWRGSRKWKVCTVARYGTAGGWRRHPGDLLAAHADGQLDRRQLGAGGATMRSSDG